MVARGRRVKLGVFPQIPWAMARDELPNVVHRLKSGLDPQPEWLRAAAPRSATGKTLQQLADAYAAEFKLVKRAQGFNVRSLEVLATIMKDSGSEAAETFDVARWHLDLLKPRKVTVTKNGKSRVVSRKGNTAVTANRKLDALRSLYAWASTPRSEGEAALVAVNRCDGVKRFKAGNVTRERVRIPSDADEARLQKHIEGYLLDAYAFARNTGLRLSELRALRRSDIHPDGVHIKKSKSGKARVVPLNAAALDVLSHRPRKKSALLFAQAFKRPWIAARARAEFDYTWNEATRHAFCSALLRNSVAPFTVMKLAGHSSLEMLEKYYGHVLSTDAADAVRLAT